MNQPKRKRIRLPEYDYSTPGAYFVTICTENRRCILSTITVGAAISRLPDTAPSDGLTPTTAVGAAISRPPDKAPVIVLTRYGEIVKQAIEQIPGIYPQISIDCYVIMPNHIHLILRIDTDADGRLIAAPTVSTVIGQMKRWASKTCGVAIWQKSFHEHIIRREADYRQIWDYIDTNPAKWAEDCYYTP